MCHVHKIIFNPKLQINKQKDDKRMKTAVKGEQGIAK